MNADRHRQNENDAATEAVLAALRSAAPDEGLEQRVLKRLATEAQAASRIGWRRYVSRADLISRPHLAPPPGVALNRHFALPAALACTLCVAATLLHYVHPANSELAHGSASPRETSIRPNSAVVHAPPSASASLVEEASLRAEHTRSPRDRSGEAPLPARGDRDGEPAFTVPAEASAASTREQSFPAPEMPLTEQERLLLRIAHRNDPVQVAMLDPVERNLQLAREQAASARFVAPAPLPAELQHEIDKAIRSQYVNTPPPEPNPTDRSLP